MHIGCHLEKVILDQFKYGFQLLLCCLFKDFLTEKVGYLMHHKLVKGNVLLAEEVTDEILHEFALRLLSLIVV